MNNKKLRQPLRSTSFVGRGHSLMDEGLIALHTTRCMTLSDCHEFQSKMGKNTNTIYKC